MSWMCECKCVCVRERESKRMSKRAREREQERGGTHAHVCACRDRGWSQSGSTPQEPPTLLFLWDKLSHWNLADGPSSVHAPITGIMSTLYQKAFYISSWDQAQVFTLTSNQFPDWTLSPAPQKNLTKSLCYFYVSLLWYVRNSIQVHFYWEQCLSQSFWYFWSLGNFSSTERTLGMEETIAGVCVCGGGSVSGSETSTGVVHRCPELLSHPRGLGN